MSLYKQYKTDNLKEVNGVEIETAQNEDGSFATFIISRAGESNKAYQKAIELASKPYRRQIDMGILEPAKAEEIYFNVFCETILKGWKNVFDENGEAIEFSIGAAKKLLTDLPELYKELNVNSNKLALFRVTGLENDSKN